MYVLTATCLSVSVPSFDISYSRLCISTSYAMGGNFLQAFEDHLLGCVFCIMGKELHIDIISVLETDIQIHVHSPAPPGKFCQDLTDISKKLKSKSICLSVLSDYLQSYRL